MRSRATACIPDEREMTLGGVVLLLGLELAVVEGDLVAV